MASATPIDCSVDENGNINGHCPTASDSDSGMFLGADATSLGSEISNLSNFMWGVEDNRIALTNPNSSFQEYSDLNFKFDAGQVVSGNQGGTGTNPYTITLGTDNGANRAFLLNVGDKTLSSNLRIDFANSQNFTYYLVARGLDGNLTLSDSGKFIANLGDGISGAISNTGVEATFNIKNKNNISLLTIDSITANGGTNNFNFTGSLKKLTTVKVNSKISATGSGKNNFTLDSTTSDRGGINLTLNGDTNQIAAFTTFGKKQNTLTITNGATANSISTLTLGTTTGTPTNGTLNLNTANALAITNLNVAHQSGTLNIDSNSQGKVTITTATLGDGKTLTIDNANTTQALVINTLTTTSGTNTLNLNKGDMTIEKRVTAGKDVTNNFNIGDGKATATLKLEGGFLTNDGTNAFVINANGTLDLGSQLNTELKTSSGITSFTFNEGASANLLNTKPIIAEQSGTNIIDTAVSFDLGEIKANGGTNKITLRGTTGATTTMNISGAISGNGTNNFKLDSTNGTTALTLNGATNQITSLNVFGENGNTLTITNANAGGTQINNSISTLTLGAKATTGTNATPAKNGTLTLNAQKALGITELNVAHQSGTLNIDSNSKGVVTITTATLDGKTLTIDNADTTQALVINTLTTSDTNTLNLNKGATTIEGAITAGGTNQFNLTGTSNNGTSVVFEGAISGTNNFTLDSSGANTKTALTLNGASNAINTFTALGGDNKLTITNNTAGTNKIEKLNLGESASNGTKTGFLTIDNSSDKVLEITNFASQNANNILTISAGEVKITNTLQGEHNNIVLDSTKGATALTLNGGNLNKLETIGKNGNTINFQASTTITSADGITAEASVINNITLEKDVTLNSAITTNGGTNNVTLNSATLNPKGATNTITTLNLNQDNNTINLAGEDNPSPARKEFRLLKVGKTTPEADTGLTNSGSLTFISYLQDPTKVQGASLGGENASAGSDAYGYAYTDRVLVLNAGNNSKPLDGSYSMELYYNKGLINLDEIQYTSKAGTEQEGNIAVLTIAQVNGASGSAKNKGIFKLKDKSITRSGLDFIETTLNAVETDENGKVNADATQNKYVTYFVGKATAVDPEPEPDPKPPVDPSDPNDPDNDNTGNQGNKPNNGLGNIQQQQREINSVMEKISFSIIDLYLANFNSLNKRMGELRENNHSQGIWGRVFNGQQGNNLGIQSKTNYITAQAGYDYAFGFEGANNYLGFALSYSHSSGYKSHLTKINQMKLDGFDTQLVELALYNSYVADSGWYNDSIAKASFMMNSISIKDDTPKGINGAKADFNSFALSLSNEFGYRFLLGEDKEWSIDPQAELGVGYINGSEFILKAIDGMKYADMTINSMINLRSRMGASLGYDFKSFIEEKDFKARVYVGLFYEMDYFHFKGDGKMKYKTSRNFIYKIQKNNNLDHRAVLNLGTNLTIKDATRIYLDFEKSFGGKITTNYKINAGVRYSFGENAGYKLKESQINGESESVDSESKAPLKLEKQDKQEKQENTAPLKIETGEKQEKKNVENKEESKEAEKNKSIKK